MGARAIIPVLVAPGRYLQANSLLGLVAQGATMVGPAMAGLVAAVWAPTTAIVVDGASFLALAAGVLIAARQRRSPSAAEVDAGQGVQTSLTRTSTQQLLRMAMPVFATTALFHILYGGFVVGLPLLASARNPQDGGAGLLGIMWSLFGVGAVISGVLAPRFPTLVRPRLLPAMALGWGVCMCVIALASNSAVMVLAMLVGGLAYGPYNAVVSTLLQRDLPTAGLIEVSGYYGALTATASPLGIMLAGFASSVVAPRTILAAAGSTLVIAGTSYTGFLWTQFGVGEELASS